MSNYHKYNKQIKRKAVKLGDGKLYLGHQPIVFNIFKINF